MALLGQLGVCDSALAEYLDVNIDNRNALRRSSSLIPIFWL